MIITNCPRCGAMNATTTCAKCGWSQFTKSTVSTRITGETELKVSGKALLDDYKRLLLENRNLKERIAELKESDKHWAGNVKVCMQLIERYESAIAELEAENDQLTAHDATERQDDKCSKPEPNVCEACGGDGTVLLTDGYKGQVIATAKCIYCNGTGRVNKEREE